MVVDKKKLKFIDIKNVGKFLIIDSSMNEESIINYIIKNNIENLSFNQYDGFSSKDMKPYSNINAIKRLEIVLDNIESDQVVKFKNLMYLYMSSPLKTKMDLSIFTKLQYLNLEWNTKILNLNTLDSLKSLTLRKYKGNPVNLTKLKSIEELIFIQGNINSLNFISSLKKIKKLGLFYLKNILEIKPIKYVNLEDLEIDSCKNIQYEDSLFFCKELRQLKISDSSSLPNLSFLTRLKDLKFLSFVGTNIEDGDITPCLNLNYVGFDNKRHYNCVNIDGKAIIKNNK
tara:strand:- start:2829 stop:3686 length:858 start_codon:yes stop_codon:yes gene_type:complete